MVIDVSFTKEIVEEYCDVDAVSQKTNQHTTTVENKSTTNINIEVRSTKTLPI